MTTEFINRVATVEQNMAVGQDEKGKALDSAKLIKELTEIMDHKKISIDNKARLCLVYYITQTPEMSKVEELAKRGGVPTKYLKALTNLKVLGVKSKEPVLGSITKLISKLMKKEDDADFLLLSRYKTKLKENAEELIKGNMKDSAYPYIKAPDSSFKLDSSAKKSSGKKKEDEAADADEEKTSLRSKKRGEGPAWKKDKDAASSSSSNLVSGITADTKTKKLIIFVLGGITHSELRAATELRDEYKLDVYCGGTSVITPSSYVEKVATVIADEDIEGL